MRAIAGFLLKQPEAFISGILLGCIGLLIFFEVFARFLFHYTPSGIEEVKTLFFIWFVFLGSVAAMRRKGHVRIEFFVSRLSPLRQQFFLILVDVLVLIFLGVLAFYGLIYTRLEMLSVSAILEIPEGYFAFSIPVASFLMALYCALSLKGNLKKFFRMRGENS